MKKAQIKIQEYRDPGLDPPLFIQPIPNPESAKKKVKCHRLEINIK